MKKKFRFLLLFAVLALAACSGNDPVDSGNQEANMETRFLSVNIVPTSDMGTRAYESGDPNDGNSQYEEGSSTENGVSSIRFYFFDADGNSAAVKADGSNYLDWSEIADASPNKDLPSIERILQATLVIDTSNGDSLPAQIVAVANPDTDYPADGTLSVLAAFLSDHAARANAATSPAFAMSNSVYLKNGEIVCANKLATTDFHTDKNEAESDPINIYLERCVAKVRVTAAVAGATSQADGSVLVPAKTKDGEAIPPVKVDGTETNLYIKVKGWNIANSTDKGRMIKEIDPAWTDEALGFVWNWNPYFRSFWAATPATGITTVNVPYSAIAKGFADGSNVLYANENTRGETDATQVIVAATLCDQNGNAIELAEYCGERIVGEAALKAMYLVFLKNDASYYKVDGSAYTLIDAADITFKTTSEIDATATEDLYFVYPQLAGVASTDADYETPKWATSNAAGTAATLSNKDINEKLAALNRAKIWKSGQTYFFAPITHLATDETKTGRYGVVRNHLYDFTIKSVTGLGTPVYKADEVIYPEKPESDYSYLAAQINILSWRVVPGDLELTD